MKISGIEKVSLAVISIVILFGMSSPKRDANATAQRITGLDVYVYSEPTRDYEVIDNGKVLMTITGGCSEVVNQAVKKSAKNKEAQGVIVYLESSKWSAIKYK